MTIPVVRKRAKKPKTRTGCRTCRARHIKCDEARPSCRRCVASNRECAGYDVVRPSATASQCTLLPKQGDLLRGGGSDGGGEVDHYHATGPHNGSSNALAVATNGSDLLPLHNPMIKPSNVFLQMTSYEAHAYDFFRSKTISQLPGSSWTLNWERLALQAGHYEPAITHAAIALGSIHRAVSVGGNSPSSSPGTMALDVDREQKFFALTQYNKALGLIRRYIETLENGGTNRDVEVVLLVSLLFFCFEILVNEDDRATLHLRTGLRILYEKIRKLDEYRSTSRMVDVEGQEKRVVRIQTRPRTNMDVLLQTFVRLDGDLTIVGDEEPYLFPVCHEKIPSSFFCLEEAMVHLDAIATGAHGVCRDIVMLADRELVLRRPEVDLLDEDMRNCLACAYSRTIALPEEHEVRLSKVKSDVNAWMSALACWSVTDSKQPALLLTQINFFYTWFLVMSWRDESEMLVDRFDAQFQHILDLVEQYIHAHGGFTSEEDIALQTQQFSTTRQAFTVGTDVVPCIGMIAYKSRNTEVRRKGIRLLRAINLSGIFDANYLAGFGQAIWEMEESQARAINGIPEGIDLECHQVPEEVRLVEVELGTADLCDAKSSFYKNSTGRMVYAYYKNLETRELDVADKYFLVNRAPMTVQGPFGSPDLSPSEGSGLSGASRMETAMKDCTVSDTAGPSTNLSSPTWDAFEQFDFGENAVPSADATVFPEVTSTTSRREMHLCPRRSIPGSQSLHDATLDMGHRMFSPTMQTAVPVGFEQS